MLNKRQSELLTQTGPGTPMGELMRQYWIPALMSKELEADGPPRRLLLLGEKLVAFRDTSGRVGIFDHKCPHRCASLFFGRNEENGLRCVYHGWKFDVDGACLDQPNIMPALAKPDRVRAKAYKVHEQNGLVWVYLGARAQPPAFPELECAFVPETELNLMMVQRECNWLQALEGDIDTSHFGFLHAGKVDPEQLAPDSWSRYALIDKAPDYHVEDTDWGTVYAAHRPGGKGETYWRYAHFLFPFWTAPPEGNFKKHIVARAWVPMDDTHCMFVHLSWTGNAPPMVFDAKGNQLPGIKFQPGPFLPDSNDWLGRWRLAQNYDNDYGLDRAAQARDNYSGIDGIHLQDQALTESMGGVVDHGSEHLVPSDKMIVQTRLRLLSAAEAFARDGTVPPGIDDPHIYGHARSGDLVAPEGQSFHEVYADWVKASANPTGKLRLAAE